MSIGKWKFTLTLLFLSVFLIVYNAASGLAATSSKVTQINNPFRSLLPEKNNSVSLPQSHSKSVSTKKQNKDLERQTKRLTKKYPKAKIITEIASGLNYKRKGLQTILEQAMSGDSIKLVVTYKDRLARFGFELIQYIIERNGGSIVVLKNHKLSPQQELTEDMLSVMHSFSSKLYGMRKFKRIKM